MRSPWCSRFSSARSGARSARSSSPPSPAGSRSGAASGAADDEGASAPIESAAMSPMSRLGAGYGAIVFMLPYLALKIAWLTGNAVGFRDESLVSAPGMMFANALSFGMDFVAVGLALTFAHGWGLRVPAWLVLFPMWVATGFLAPAILLLPISIISQMSASRPAPSTPSMLQPWVGLVVGSSFAGQGAALIVAFVLYLRTRWADLLEATIRPAVTGRTRRAQVMLATSAALMAVAAGGLHLVWAFGGTAGLGDRELSGPRGQSYLLHGIWGVMGIAGATGILAMVHRWSRAPFKLLLAITWIGAGSLFAWGLWSLIFVLSGIRFGPRTETGSELMNILSVVQFTAGTLIGLVAVILLAERRAAIRSPEGRAGPGRGEEAGDDPAAQLTP